MDPKDRIIVALDGMGLEAARQLILLLASHMGAFKVGFELITKQEAGLVADFAAEQRVGVFYDGKFHDIPQTVANASAAVAERASINMFNVHCLGGTEMMQAARQAIEGGRGAGRRPLVLGVTILTSHDYDSLVRLGLLPELMPEILNLPDSGAEQMQSVITSLVVELATLAQTSGLDGVIASPWEIEAVRQACGPDFLIVTPGVRPAGSAANDQKRVMTPGEAIRLGADYLVIGRPITRPDSGTPVEAAQRIAEEIYLAEMRNSIPEGQASPL